MRSRPALNAIVDALHGLWFHPFGHMFPAAVDTPEEVWGWIAEMTEREWLN